jgi:hypothetical protein
MCGCTSSGTSRHPDPRLGKVVYGLPELFADRIGPAQRG